MRGGETAQRRLRRSQRLPGRVRGPLAGPAGPPGQGMDSQARNRAVLGLTGPMVALIQWGGAAILARALAEPARAVPERERGGEPPSASCAFPRPSWPPSCDPKRGGEGTPAVPSCRVPDRRQAHPAGCSGTGVARPPQEPSSSATSASLQEMGRSYQRSSIPPPPRHHSWQRQWERRPARPRECERLAPATGRNIGNTISVQGF